ncbi:MAG: ACT domain-containing protein [Anaerolineae bacterium]|nr:ACT domain-containing protein [Anaerolineae bacterium]
MATEFTIQLEDRPGVLADLAEALAKSAINIVAIHASQCLEGGHVQLITDNTDATINVLKHLTLDYTVLDVLLVTIPHQPGTLARIARALANASVNLNAVYITMTGQIVLDVSDFTKAQQIVMNMDPRP